MRLVKVLTFCVLLLVFTWFASAVLKPAALSRQSWYTYRDLPKNSVNTLFLGTSHTYSAIDPRIVDEDASAAGQADSSSFVLSGSGQSMALTYYTLKDALRYQSPRIVALEAFRIIGEQRMADNNAMANFHYWPWSPNKVAALLDATNPENREAIALPLAEYHSRWGELSRGDFGISAPLLGVKGKLHVGSDLRGYTPVRNTEAVKPLPPVIDAIDEGAWNRNYPWLKKIAQLCDEQDIQLVLFWTPNAMEGQATYIEAIRSAFSEQYPNIVYCDFNPLMAELGIGYEQDFADETHTNVSGAQKVSRYMGKLLAELR